MFSILGSFKPYLAIGVVGAFMVLLVGSYSKGRIDGKAAAAREAVKAVVAQLEERGQINEAVQDTDIVAICIELGGNPDDCRMQDGQNN